MNKEMNSSCSTKVLLHCNNRDLFLFRNVFPKSEEADAGNDLMSAPVVSISADPVPYQLLGGAVTRRSAQGNQRLRAGAEDSAHRHKPPLGRKGTSDPHS